MTPDDLLDATARLLATTSLPLGARTRAAALLARRALESSVDEALRRAGARPDRASLSGRMLALPALIDDEALARRAFATWHALSEACHHHGYELPPSADELASRVHTVRQVVAALAPTRPPSVRA